MLGALSAGVIADALGLAWAIRIIAALSLLSGAVAALLMRERSAHERHPYAAKRQAAYTPQAASHSAAVSGILFTLLPSGAAVGDSARKAVAWRCLANPVRSRNEHICGRMLRCPPLFRGHQPGCPP